MLMFSIDICLALTLINYCLNTVYIYYSKLYIKGARVDELDELDEPIADT